ncbi:ARM repeat-containing protein [Rickenella mellea]|uniref:non-specific serine/threonine protein kinase n=1 Tax=Rickenella mellea TaxID=50990 RepID=A0A4Y7PVW3_9AGAM|nr:ARM repeat-containing protein [Rickenella mellea]
MGNNQSGSVLRTGGALDSFVAELGPDIAYEKSLGTARFLKTVKCRHRNGYLVVKIFIKPDPGLSLRTPHRRLKIEREALHDVSNVYNYQSFVETDRAGYIVRQWVASSLYDRISTRPFLTTVEKKWISFQVLTALCDARKRKVSHGDIKSENILVTSWNWVYITDFASFKPTYLPLDNPSDFAFYFDISGRRNCYIAPERFYTAEKNPEISAKKAKLKDDESIAWGESSKRDGKVTEAMDIFSAGCVLAELFLEGASIFSLSQLFKYREGELDIDSHLAVIEDAAIRNLIKQMIALDPAKRPTFDALLHGSRGTIFPECFYSFLHNFISSVNELSTPLPFVEDSSQHQHPPQTVTRTPQNKPAPTNDNVNPSESPVDDRSPLPADSDHRIDRIWSEFETVEPYLTVEAVDETVTEAKIEYTANYHSTTPLQDILPVHLHIPNRSSKISSAFNYGRRAAREDGPALIILSLVCANIRNCSLPSSKVRGLDVLLALSPYLTDEAKLDRLIPYIVDVFHDDAAIVRAAALRTLLQILMLVTVISPFNSAIFPEYILLNLRNMGQDTDESVRSMFAQCIVPIADTAARYLEMGQALKAHGALKLASLTSAPDEAQYEVSYDIGMEDLQRHIQDQLSELLMDKSSVVKRAVLHDISALCIFFGRQKTNDVLLSHMITYLNDRDWLLRFAFFDSIVDVAACLGARSLEEYILPLMMQALTDVEDAVVAKVLTSLTSLCELGLFQRPRVWELMSATLPLLYHPDIWIRQGAAAFIASAAKYLPTTDVWCILYPSLKHFLRCEIQVVDVRSILLSLKSPLSRHIFDSAVEWAMKSDQSPFWRGHRRNIKNEQSKDGITTMKKTMKAITKATTPRSEDDEIQLRKLEQLGMSSAEEPKLLALRDYMLKLAGAIDSFRSRPKDEAINEPLKTIGDIKLQALGVVPQTIFLGGRLQSDRSSLGSAVPELPRLSRVSSVDHNIGGSGAPFEDLRRRLATINGSTSSLNSAPSGRDRNVSLSSGKKVNAPVVSDLPPTVGQARPGSPTESIVSTANSVSVRHRLQVGSTDGQKAAPAIGSVKTNAMGMLEGPSRLRSENSSERSGWNSPASVADTVRGGRKRLTLSSNDGQELGPLNNILDDIYMQNNQDGQNDFGPPVHDGPIRRRNVARQTFTSRDGKARSFEANLIAHLSSHSDAITGLAASPDHLFFVSASHDKTVKIWDTSRLERNVTSKPRHTYGQHHARIKCLCMLEGVHCFASAAEDGSLHVVRVHVNQSSSLPKYSKTPQVVREHRVDRAGEYITCMTHYNTETSSNLLYATSHSTIAILDLKSMRILQSMENPRHAGPIVSLCVDRKRTWLIAATLTGVMSLWDLRFGLRLRIWRAGSSVPTQTVRIHECVIHPTKGRGRWIIVALGGVDSRLGSAGSLLMEVWDIETVTLVETFVTRSTSSENVPESTETPTVDAEMSPAAAITNLVNSRPRGEGNDAPRQPMSPFNDFSGNAQVRPSSAIRAMVVGVDFGGISSAPRPDFIDLTTENTSQGRPKESSGYMLTGSEDCVLRFWDLNHTDKSTVLSSPEENEKPTFSTSRSPSDASSTHVETVSDHLSMNTSTGGRQRSAVITQHQQNLLKAHQDCITTVACIDSPFRGGIVTGDRAGVIKVWRVEGLDNTSSPYP